MPPSRAVKAPTSAYTFPCPYTISSEQRGLKEIAHGHAYGVVFAILMGWSALFVPASARAELRVAVLEFSNASKDPELDALGKGLQSMVTTDLAALQMLKVVERERLKDVQAELKLARGAGFDKKTAAKLGKLSGASHLFVGSYTVVGESMRLDGRLLEVSSGQVLLAEQIAGEKALFFELEQKLVQKVIGALGLKLLPKEKAALSRVHTADFGALRKFSEGLQAFDDGKLEQAMKALNEAKTIDADFRLASLTLGEYERLAAEVRAKAEAAGKLEAELEDREKNAALSAETSVLKKLWQLLTATQGNTTAAKVRRVATLCALSSAYGTALGFRNRGPVNAADLARAGFDDFTLKRTSDALFKRAWAEAPDVFPDLPPLCVGIGALSSGNPRPVEELIGYEIKDARELSAKRDVLLSYIANNATVDPAAERLQLDPVGEAKLWEKLYGLSQKLPGLLDEERARFEKTIAERRRAAGDFDGSTQMYAAASRHSKDSYELKEYAREIDRNKALKLAVGTRATPLREYFLLHPSVHESELERLVRSDSAQQLAERLERARDLDVRGGYVLINDIATWYTSGPTYATLRTGPRSSARRANELRYDGRARPPGAQAEPPVLLATAERGQDLVVKATIDQSEPPAGFRRAARETAVQAGEVGVAFGMKRLVPEGGIERGAPVITMGHAVLIGNAKVRLVRITRDGEHKVSLTTLAEAEVDNARVKRALEVRVQQGAVSVSVAGRQVSFPWKPAPTDAEGYVGYVFYGPGFASLAEPSIRVGGS